MNTDLRLLKKIANLDAIPTKGAFNIRKNGQGLCRNSSENIEIKSKQDKPGIDIIIKPGTKGESVHIPVIITEQGINDLVYNDFYIGEDADVTIIAGCGIHNEGDITSEHNGLHRFFIKKGAKVRYIEKHYGEGGDRSMRIMNPSTEVELGENSSAVFEMVQIRGIDSTERSTKATLGKNSRFEMTERLLTHGNQTAKSNVEIYLEGKGSAAEVSSRTVAQQNSVQIFYPRMIGKAECRGHIQCDSIIMDKAQVRSIPEVAAYHPDAQLIHEAAIGKIAADQIIKLMTLGLTEQEAEERILQAFLK